MIRGEEKIRGTHRERLAYVYVRQSSPTQVRNNLESQERQYELRGLVEALGWPLERIVTIDEDQAHTASGTRERTGLSQIRADVCEERVGLVMGIETTRLARNNREWYHLLDLCAVCGTLVGEPGGVYDPKNYEDRLQLGLKGLFNEMELHTLKNRLGGAVRHKAEKGELSIKLPIGLVEDAQGKVVLDPNEGVQQAVRTLLQKLPELGSALKVFRWGLENALKMPHRVGSGLFSEVVFEPLTYPDLLRLYKNPRYAGAYVFGRTERYLKIEGGEPRHHSRSLPIDKWRVLIQGAHPGYITWEEYLGNRELLAQNSVGKQQGRGAPGRGHALLQGLIRCGWCAARMQVYYRIRRDGGKGPWREATYLCSGGGGQHLRPSCQQVRAAIVDPVVREAFLQALKPAELEVSLEAFERLDESRRAAERHWELKLERSQYEAERARRQYDRVEPEDRLVARELERRWEERLKELKRIEDEYGHWKQGKEEAWGPEMLEELRGLVRDVRKLWEAESTTNEDRKELLRLLLEDVWVWARREKREVEVRILWKGGCQTVHRVPWRLNGRWVEEDVIRRVRELALQGLPDTKIAQRLNAEGHRRSQGGAFLQDNVTHIRQKHGIPKADPPREPGTYSAREAIKKLGVSKRTFRNWIRHGEVSAYQDRPGGQWKVRMTGEDEARLTGQWDREKELTVREAAKYLGIPISRVYKRVKAGMLSVRRAWIGRRRRLLIPMEGVKQGKGRIDAGRDEFTGHMSE